MDNEKKTEILRQEESWDVLNSVTDLRTRQLLNKATMCIVNSYAHSENKPMSDFDLKFFVQAMLGFCSDHENLQRILAGEDLRWFDTSEVSEGRK